MRRDNNQRRMQQEQLRNDGATPLTITLATPFIVDVIPAQEITISVIEIVEIVDNFSNKTIIARLKSMPFQIVLWEGDAYDAIGQWTDVDVQNKIKELYS